jgi:hypothetical protein
VSAYDFRMNFRRAGCEPREAVGRSWSVSLRARLIALVCAALAAACIVPASAAAIVVKPAENCPAEQWLTPFAQWDDHRNYVRVDGGGFEEGAPGWTLRRADVVVDNHPWPAVSPADRHALRVRGSATSPGFCVGLGHPTIRFFARNTGSPLGALLVEAVVTTSVGLKLPLPIGLVLKGNQRWAPTPQMLMLANLLTLLPPHKTRVEFRFTAIGLGSEWRIDDVFVDPYSKR